MTTSTDAVARPGTPGWRAIPHRWPSVLGLAAVGLQVVTGVEREGVAIVVGVALLCYLGAAALDRPWVAWAAVPAASVVVAASKILDVPWWIGIGAVTLVVLVAGLIGADDRPAFTAQTAALVGYGAFVAVALVIAPRAGLALVGAALAAHAVWDLVHYRRDRVVPRSLAEFCMVLDAPLGVIAIAVAVAG